MRSRRRERGERGRVDAAGAAEGTVGCAIGREFGHCSNKLRIVG